MMFGVLENPGAFGQQGMQSCGNGLGIFQMARNGLRGPQNWSERRPELICLELL